MAFGSFDSKQSGGHTMSEINMVPLIDVMLVLLVIFIITAPLLAHSVRINLPQASSEQIEENPKTIDLAIDAGGVVFWNEEIVLLDDLTGRFASISHERPQPEVRIRADLNTRYETLARVMASARRSGIARIGFVTQPGAPGSAADSAAGTAAPAAQPQPASGAAAHGAH
ncbi:ExbD/TolR family protein [Kerstersia similis]|uniref:ExbD/TolR family protein n=1 Tax=Kerstersia similis TaxID=206505 RepID=UPI0039EE8618